MPFSKMSRHLLVIPIIAALLAGNPACAEEKANPAIKVAAGKEFTFSLESNVSTGFAWQLAAPLDESTVKFVKSVYQSTPKPPGKEPAVGAPGKEVWTFKALKSGETTIEIKYVRPWEKDELPAKTKSFQVVVEPTNNQGKMNCRVIERRPPAITHQISKIPRHRRDRCLCDLV